MNPRCSLGGGGVERDSSAKVYVRWSPFCLKQVNCTLPLTNLRCLDPHGRPLREQLARKGSSDPPSVVSAELQLL